MAIILLYSPASDSCCRSPRPGDFVPREEAVPAHAAVDEAAAGECRCGLDHQAAILTGFVSRTVSLVTSQQVISLLLPYQTVTIAL